MRRFVKHLAATLSLFAAGCAAGGSGCSSCALTPLPEGFKPEARIENAGSARLTQAGLHFLEQNVGTLAQTLLGGSATGGIMTFPINSSTGSALGIDYTLCPGGPDGGQSPPKCVAEIDLGNAQLQIDPTAPHSLRIHGPLPIRLQNLPIEIDYGIFGTDTAIATLNGNGGCPPGEQTYANIDLDVDISIEIDTDQAHSRYGYTRVKVASLSVNENQLEDAIHLNCGDSPSGSILNFFKGIVVPMLADGMIGTLSDSLNQQLCQQANPELSPPCPGGTSDEGGGTCVYPDGSCASILLGIDGNINLGQLLASISPGTKGGLNLLFAAGGQSARDDGSGFAWGDLNPIGGGATIGMYGGAEPMPVSNCVKLSDIPLPAGIPIPDELQGNTVTGWPDELEGPHVGIAVSERFANYALNGMYNSGLLCLGITTESVPLLNSGTLGLLVPSSKDLALQQEQQQLAIVVRPGLPPRLTFGNGTSLESDPLVRVQLDQASFDFYVWSLDRFVRFMTATFDLDVPANLVVTPEGLVPVIETVGVNNGKVTNNALVREDPQQIADALAGLISSQVGQAVGGGISPIDINGSLAGLGLTLTIPESVDGQGSPGLRKLAKAEDNYLGIFASFGIASQGSQLVAETKAQARNKEVDAAGLKLQTMTRDNAPRVELVMSADIDDGTRPVEYQYRVDQGAWHPFTRDRIIDLQDDWLRLQGRHVVSVRARVVGDAMSLDPTPAEVEVVVDVDPPAIAVGPVEDGKALLTVKDRVSGADQAEVRFRLDGGAWSPWQRASEVGPIAVDEADAIEVEARDEEGNVGTAQHALIRGRGNVDPSAGCGCEVAGGSRSSSPAGWIFVAALAAIGARLKKRRQGRGQGGGSAPYAPLGRQGRGQGGGSAPYAPLGRQGRGQGGGSAPYAPLGGRYPAEAGRSSRRSLRQRVAQGALGLAVVAMAGAQAGCNCGDDPAVTAPQCGPGCTTLEPGLIGAYTSVAVSGDKVWVAGYAEGNWVQGFSWGDLAVGTLEGDQVVWGLVDGVPAEPPVDPKLFSPGGFRGGQSEPGDDVGTWTSIAIGPDGEPAVAYYDRGNRRLKFAQRVGGAWQVSVVNERPTADIGRYAKLLFVNGAPVIAFLAMEPGEGGAVTSAVRLAWGGNAAPGAGQWTFEDVALDPATPCREHLCDGNAVCVLATGRCTQPTAGCASECGTGTECIDEAGTLSCMSVVTGSKLDTYPDAIGDYIAIAPDGAGGIGVAFYDRIHGNVVVASKANGAWESVVVDGQAADGTDTGDVGIGLTLFIDGAGDWHLAYADGLAEGVRYQRVKGGAEAGVAEVVDDGLGLEGTPFEDGQHIVGDDASLFVTAGGEVHISYQDATSGTLRHAVGTPSGDGHSWLVEEIQQDGFAGAFSKIVEVGGQIRIANWWRVGGQEVRGDVAFVSP